MNGFKEIALHLQNRLLDAGFVIQRYDAYSTNSIYLKLDYGICNSIRISDHTGKRHLNYMFNLGKDINKFQRVKNEYTRYYYPFNQMDALITHILAHRQSKMTMYGAHYQDEMEKKRQEKQNSVGFWREAYLVKKEAV